MSHSALCWEGGATQAAQWIVGTVGDRWGQVVPLGDYCQPFMELM